MNVYSCSSVNIRYPLVYYYFYKFYIFLNRFNYLNTYINESALYNLIFDYISLARKRKKKERCARRIFIKKKNALCAKSSIGYKNILFLFPAQNRAYARPNKMRRPIKFL